MTAPASGNRRESSALAAARETLYQRAREKEPEGKPPPMVQQQADALALLAETALHHGIDPGAPGERYHSPSSKTARAFRLERPSAWRATPAGW